MPRRPRGRGNAPSARSQAGETQHDRSISGVPGRRLSELRRIDALRFVCWAPLTLRQESAAPGPSTMRRAHRDSRVVPRHAQLTSVRGACSHRWGGVSRQHARATRTGAHPRAANSSSVRSLPGSSRRGHRSPIATRPAVTASAVRPSRHGELTYRRRARGCQHPDGSARHIVVFLPSRSDQIPSPASRSARSAGARTRRGPGLRAMNPPPLWRAWTAQVPRFRRSA